MTTTDTTQSLPVLFEELHCANGARIGIARLNAPKSLNALTLQMIDLLTERLLAWRADPNIVLVLLEGSGDRAFCAGADLHRMHKTMQEHRASPRRDDMLANTYALDFFVHEYRLDHIIHTYPKPVLCWGQGVVMGGGMGLMVGASHRVVTEQARIAMPEITIGLYADVGGSWFLNRSPGHTGLFLALAGARLNASDTIFAGLADYQIDHAKKPAIMQRITQHPWEASPGKNATALSTLLREYMSSSTPGPLRTHFDLINEICARPALSDVIHAITSLKSEDAWLTTAGATLAQGSPGSAALSLALQRRLKHCSLAEVFRAELVASMVCTFRPDLSEGIRALLIDKDRQPQWNPPNLDAVDDAWVDGFFRSPWQANQHPLADLT